MPACVAVLLSAYVFLKNLKDPAGVFHCCFCCMFVAQLFMGYLLMVEYSTWDVYAVVKNARGLVHGTYVNVGYFARYPNNIGIMLLFAGVFSITEALWSSTSVYFLVVLNIVAIDCAVLLIVRIVQQLYNKALACRVGVCLTLFAPLYLYVPICYTDTFIMPFLTGVVYLAIKIVKTYGTNRYLQNSMLAFMLGVVIMLGIKIKATLIIALIASCFYWAYTLKPKAVFHVLSFVFVGIVTIILIWNNWIQPISKVTDELLDEYQFPVFHWIAMGLEKSGNYNADLVKYTASFPTYAERVTADLSKISEQVRNLGPSGVIQQFYKKAVTYGWNFGTCYAERYIGDYGDVPRLKNILHEFFLSQGKYHDVVYMVTQSCWIIYMGFTMVGFIKNIFSRDYHRFYINLLLIGCMMFFMIWETHPRYILHYSLFVVASGVITLDSVTEWCKNRSSLLLRKLMKKSV